MLNRTDYRTLYFMYKYIYILRHSKPQVLEVFVSLDPALGDFQ